MKRAGLWGEPKAPSPGQGGGSKRDPEVTQPGDSEPDPGVAGFSYGIGINNQHTHTSPGNTRDPPGCSCGGRDPAGAWGQPSWGTTSASTPAGGAPQVPGQGHETPILSAIPGQDLVLRKPGRCERWGESVGQSGDTGPRLRPPRCTRQRTPLWKTYIVGGTVGAAGVPHRGWARHRQLSPSFFDFLRQFKRWCVNRKSAASGPGTISLAQPATYFAGENK